MVSLQVLPGPSQFAEQELHQVPARQVQRTVAVDKLLPFPSSSAQKLYAMWSVGVPLAAVGNMDGMNMQVRGGLQRQSASVTQTSCVLWLCMFRHLPAARLAS